MDPMTAKHGDILAFDEVPAASAVHRTLARRGLSLVLDPLGNRYHVHAGTPAEVAEYSKELHERYQDLREKYDERGAA